MSDQERGQLVGELPDRMERRAAALWRSEHPDMSVFACDAAMKSEYRRRVLEEAEREKA